MGDRRPYIQSPKDMYSNNEKNSKTQEAGSKQEKKGPWDIHRGKTRLSLHLCHSLWRKRKVIGRRGKEGAGGKESRKIRRNERKKREPKRSKQGSWSTLNSALNSISGHCARLGVSLRPRAHVCPCLCRRWDCGSWNPQGGQSEC